jgi:carboxyl-terminal processing protease
MTPDERQRQLDSFDHVWQTIRDKHWEIKPGGLDWNQVRAELRPKAEKATTTAEIRDDIREMLKRLKQSHFNLISAEAMGGLSDTFFGDGQPGFEAQAIDSTALVTRVDPGVQVKLGWRLVSVRGVSIDQRISAIDTAYAQSSERGLRLHQMLQARLSGEPGSTISIDFLDESDRKVSLKIPLREPKGKPAVFGNLPQTAVSIESKQIDGNIGYVAFNLFLDPVRLMKTFTEAVTACLKCDGFIVDVRGNPGGIGIMSAGIASWFVDQPNQRLGSMFTRDSTLNFVVNPRPQAFLGPLAILVDASSASTSEIFAGGMQDLHRARIFGTKTAAAALPSVVEHLPNGDGFQYAVANYISEGGRPLEGNGVKPDEEVQMTRATLLAGRDAVVDAAVRWIRTKSDGRRSSLK